MKMKELLAAKQNNHLIDKLAAELVEEYLLKKMAAEDPAKSRKKKLLRLLATLGGTAGAATLGFALLPHFGDAVRKTEITITGPHGFRSDSIDVDYKPYGGEWSTAAKFEPQNPDQVRIDREMAEKIFKALQSPFKSSKGSGVAMDNPATNKVNISM